MQIGVQQPAVGSTRQFFRPRQRSREHLLVGLCECRKIFDQTYIGVKALQPCGGDVLHAHETAAARYAQRLHQLSPNGGNCVKRLRRQVDFGPQSFLQGGTHGRVVFYDPHSTVPTPRAQRPDGLFVHRGVVGVRGGYAQHRGKAVVQADRDDEAFRARPRGARLGVVRELPPVEQLEHDVVKGSSPGLCAFLTLGLRCRIEEHGRYFH